MLITSKNKLILIQTEKEKEKELVWVEKKRTWARRAYVRSRVQYVASRERDHPGVAYEQWHPTSALLPVHANDGQLVYIAINNSKRKKKYVYCLVHIYTVSWRARSLVLPLFNHTSTPQFNWWSGRAHPPLSMRLLVFTRIIYW